MSRYAESMEAGSRERVIFHGHPSWRSMLGFHLKGFLLAVAAGVLAGAVSAAVTGRTRAGWVVAAVLVVFVAVISAGMARRRRTTYTITTQRLTIEIGLLAREVHEARLGQVQNVRASQTLVERGLRVGDVSFDTAGRVAFDLCFRGVDHPREVMNNVNRAIGERVQARV
jgi:uncharacterized membrane protein YdbT with pleckstrin-like domain